VLSWRPWWLTCPLAACRCVQQLDASNTANASLAGLAALLMPGVSGQAAETLCRGAAEVAVQLRGMVKQPREQQDVAHAGSSVLQLFLTSVAELGGGRACCLSEVRLDGCSWAGDAALVLLAAACEELSCVSVRGCKGVSSIGAHCLAWARGHVASLPRLLC
jgi:hypothetical protein